jgi:hypothetical protein
MLKHIRFVLLLLVVATAVACTSSTAGPSAAQPQRSIDALVQILQDDGYTTDTHRLADPGNPFNTLFQQDMADLWLVRVDGQEAQVFVFDNASNAERAAATISPDALTFTGPHSVIESESDLSIPLRFWQHDNYLIRYHGNDQRLLGLFGAIFGRPVADTNLHQPATAEIKFRLLNKSNITFDSLEVNFAGQTVHYGPLAPGELSEYRLVDRAYHYASVKAIAGETVYELQPTDYVGEETLPPSRYTYELNLEAGQLTLLLIADDPLAQDAYTYAQEQGIGLEEAMGRMQNQDSIGLLQEQLINNESDTFAGLWIQHEPSYRLVVAFTREGEATLASYIAGTSLEEIVEIRPADVTYKELQTIQVQVSRLLEPLVIPVSSGINIQENIVDVYVTDMAAFEAGLQAHGIQLPPHVNITTLYEPLGNNLPFEVNPDDTIYFPQLKARSPSFMEALLIGRLEVENGCLLAYQAESNQPITIIWQTDYFLHNNDGSIEMLDREGKVVARVGEMIYLGGGQVGSINPDQLQAPIPDHCAPSSIWLMGEFLPEEYIPNVVGDTE